MSSARAAGFAGRVQAPTTAQRLVFWFLSARDVCTAEQVCSAWKRASTPALWRLLYQTARIDLERREFDECAQQFQHEQRRADDEADDFFRELNGSAMHSDDESAVESDAEDEGFVATDAAGDACVDWKRKFRARWRGVNPGVR